MCLRWFCNLALQLSSQSAEEKEEEMTDQEKIEKAAKDAAEKVSLITNSGGGESVRPATSLQRSAYRSGFIDAVQWRDQNPKPADLLPDQNTVKSNVVKNDPEVDQVKKTAESVTSMDVSNKNESSTTADDAKLRDETRKDVTAICRRLGEKGPITRIDLQTARYLANKLFESRVWDAARAQTDARVKGLHSVLEAVRSQMCWERDRDQLSMGMIDLHDAVTKALRAYEEKRNGG